MAYQFKHSPLEASSSLLEPYEAIDAVGDAIDCLRALQANLRAGTVHYASMELDKALEALQPVDEAVYDWMMRCDP